MGHTTEAETHEERATNVRPIPGALEWLVAHSEEFYGRWVAIGATGLIAAGDTLEAVVDQLPSLDDVLVTMVG